MHPFPALGGRLMPSSGLIVQDPVQKSERNCSAIVNGNGPADSLPLRSAVDKNGEGLWIKNRAGLTCGKGRGKNRMFPHLRTCCTH